MLSPDIFTTKRRTPLTPSQLATKVAKESSGISIKIGAVNGRPVLHLIDRNVEDTRLASVNMDATEVAWNLHPWNKNNKPKTRKEADA